MATKRVVHTLVVDVRIPVAFTKAGKPKQWVTKTWRFRASSARPKAKEKAKAEAEARAEGRGAEIVSSKWLAQEKWRVLSRQRDGSYREFIFDHKGEAQAREQAESKAQVIGVDLELGKEKFEAVAARWRAGASVDWGAANAAQVDSFLSAHILPEFGASSVGSIRHSDVQAWCTQMRSRGLAQSTAHRVVRLLDRILETSVRDGAIYRNPCSGVDFGKDQGPVRAGLWLERPEIESVALAMPDRYRVAVLTASGAALRFQEMAGLRRDRILPPGGRSLDGKVVPLADDYPLWRIRIDSVLIEVQGRLSEKAPKTRAGRRDVPIPPWLAQALLAHCDRFEVGQTDLVFTSQRGVPLRRSNFSKRVLYPVSEEVLGQRVHTHDLRRSGISQWIADRIRPEVAQVWAGHEDQRTTMGIYHSVFPSTEAASMAQLEAANAQVDIDLGWSTSGPETGSAQSEAL